MIVVILPESWANCAYFGDLHLSDNSIFMTDSAFIIFRFLVSGFISGGDGIKKIRVQV